MLSVRGEAMAGDANSLKNADNSFLEKEQYLQEIRGLNRLLLTLHSRHLELTEGIHDVLKALNELVEETESLAGFASYLPGFDCGESPSRCASGNHKNVGTIHDKLGSS